MEESWKTSDKENCQNDEFSRAGLREIQKLCCVFETFFFVLVPVTRPVVF